MMKITLSPAVERALNCEEGVEPTHVDVLLALLSEEEGRPVAWLKERGVPVERAVDELRVVASSESQPISVSVLLAECQALALSQNADVITGEMMLVVILQLDEEIREVLRNYGLESHPSAGESVSPQSAHLSLEQPLAEDDPSEIVASARVLDANFNRAREGLRVVEDFCRFVLDDRFLSGEVKQFRHELTEVLAPVLTPSSLTSRETIRDVGTSLTSRQEEVRADTRNVVAVNLKRIQESLRALEEFAKIGDPRVARQLEQLRYRSYTLERAILGVGDAVQRLADVRLYVLLTGSQSVAALDWTIAEASRGGATMFQLREKELTDRELIKRGRNVRGWTQEVGALFIINDRPDIARLVRADGVHLGQEDLSVKEARQILGPDALIGVSTHTLDQVHQAIRDGANYIGIGPAFPSRTKQFDQLAGLEFLRSASEETTLPAFAIGGIGPENIDQVIATGVQRVAVASALTTSDDPRMTALAIHEALMSEEQREQ